MGEIVVNDFLSFEGFVDSSYSHTDTDSDSPSMDGGENSFEVDQVEISWLFDFDTVTAQIDLQYEGDSLIPAGEDGELVEQAFVNYALANGDVVTAGRYASMLGFEAFEPTGLYQYSTAYSVSGLPGYAQGVKYTRESDATFFGISIQDEAFAGSFAAGKGALGGDGNNNGDGSYAIELAYAQDLGDGVTGFLGGAFEDGDADGDTYIINTYVTYETGAWLFAAEVNFGNSESGAFDAITESSDDVDVLSGLLMANYAYSDDSSVTARLSYEEVDDGAADALEIMKYTLAHNKALADNLALITEISYGELEDGANGDDDVVELAVELLFSF